MYMFVTPEKIEKFLVDEPLDRNIPVFRQELVAIKDTLEKLWAVVRAVEMFIQESELKFPDPTMLGEYQKNLREAIAALKSEDQ